MTERVKKTKLDLHMICDFSKQPPTTLTLKFLDKKSNFMGIFKATSPEKQVAPSVDLLIQMDLVIHSDNPLILIIFLPPLRCLQTR